MPSQEFVSDASKGWLLWPVAPLLASASLAYAFYRLAARGDWVGFLILGGIGGSWLAIYLLSRGKFGVVTVNAQGVRVRQNGSEYRFSWRDVKSFRSVPLVNPPIYQMTFEDSELVTWFVPQSWRFLWFDTGGMSSFIRKQLRDVRGFV